LTPDSTDPEPIQLTAGYHLDRFLDLGDGIVSDLVQLHVRDVRHLVGWYNAVDDRGSVGGERFAGHNFRSGRNAAKLLVVPSALSDSTSCGSVSPLRRSATWIAARTP
jgi:hypothetical protein